MCVIPKPVDGQCGDTVNQCLAGTLDDVDDSDADYLWDCTGAHGGSAAMCALPIVTPPDPGFLVGDVRGNTVSVNSVAEFTVRLLSPPSADVVVPVSSSDESEGIPDKSELLFTPESWRQEQVVTVHGRNPDVSDGVQDYEIILGDAQSADPDYNGLTVPNVPMLGIFLAIDAPDPIPMLVAQIEATLEPSVAYTGHERLSFALADAPDGMVIDLSTGTILWTPEEADENMSHAVTVSVNDGALFAEVSFQISVIQPRSLVTDLVSGVLTVTDTETDLQGMTIKNANSEADASNAPRSGGQGSTGSLSDLGLMVVPDSGLHPIPENVLRVSDAFLIKQPYRTSVVIEFPLEGLPAGSTVTDVDIYALSGAEDVQGVFWFPVFVDFEYGGSADAPIIKVWLEGLQGTFFFGVRQGERNTTESSARPTEPPRIYRPSASTSDALNDVICTPSTLRDLAPWLQEGEEYRLQTCTHAQIDGLKVRVKNFGRSANATQWGGAKIEDLIGWLVEAQRHFDQLGLTYSNVFNVQIFDEPRDPSDNSLIYGFVRGGVFENWNTLHLNANAAISVKDAKATTAHEYVHHAQAKSTIEGLSPLLGTRDGKWITEGSAAWFEDRLYDHEDPHKTYGDNRILEEGLADPDGTGNAYRRFGFFKLLEKHCTLFETRYVRMINTTSGDPSGIAQITREMNNADCDFGSHLGTTRSSSLEAALTYYNYATMFRADVNLLDKEGNEGPYKFVESNYKFQDPYYPTVDEWLRHTPSTRLLILSKWEIPPAGAVSFWVEGVDGDVPDGKVAELAITTSRETLVSLVSDDPEFGRNRIGTDRHAWFSTGGTGMSSYVYESASVPKTFVTLVNPSITSSTTVNSIRFGIVDELTEVPAITSHDDNATVSNRVVTVAGTIPEAVASRVDAVEVTANGVVTHVGMNSDGSFVADVVVALGTNLVRAQGLDSTSAPVTAAKTISIQGVAAASSGRNALLASRLVLVLRWNTDRTDLDIYSTDKDGDTIWYRNRSEPPGVLDYDDTSGFGPEVVSYRETEAAEYVGGRFEVDVHYYSGSPPTAYTLDVVMNETSGANRRQRRFESVVDHTVSASSQRGPDGSGRSRHNDILTVTCDDQRICSVKEIDSDKLVRVDGRATSHSPVWIGSKFPFVDQFGDVYDSAYDACLTEYQSLLEKAHSARWYCNDDGTKEWAH